MARTSITIPAQSGLPDMASGRVPVEAQPPRMETLARLPVFFALEGKRALVAGGGAPSAWKAELLSAAGAAVDVYAEDPSEDLLALVNDAPRGVIVLHRRRWQADDFAAAAIAVGGCAD